MPCLITEGYEKTGEIDGKIWGNPRKNPWISLGKSFGTSEEVVMSDKNHQKILQNLVISCDFGSKSTTKTTTHAPSPATPAVPSCPSSPFPKRLGKLRVEVDTTVALSATRASEMGRLKHQETVNSWGFHGIYGVFMGLLGIWVGC